MDKILPYTQCFCTEIVNQLCGLSWNYFFISMKTLSVEPLTACCQLSDHSNGPDVFITLFQKFKKSQFQASSDHVLIHFSTCNLWTPKLGSNFSHTFTFRSFVRVSSFEFVSHPWLNMLITGLIVNYINVLEMAVIFFSLDALKTGLYSELFCYCKIAGTRSLIEF